MKKKKWIWILCGALLCLVLAFQIGWAGSHLEKAPFEDVAMANTLQIRTEEEPSGSEVNDQQSDSQQQEQQDSLQGDQDTTESENEEEQEEQQNSDDSSVQVQLSPNANSTDNGTGQQGSGNGQNGNGGSGSGQNGNGESGNGGESTPSKKDDDPSKKEDDPSEDDPSKKKGDPEIVTSLDDYGSDQITITYDKLPDGQLSFSAYLKNAGDDELRVRLTYDGQSGNGKILHPTDGNNYTAALQKGANTIYLYAVGTDGKTDKNIQSRTFHVSYVQKKASKDDPVVGDAPTIKTNLVENETNDIYNRNLTFRVTGIDYKNNYLTASNLEVKLDGKSVTNPTGGPEYEYQLYFENPTVGNTEKHTVTVLGWDNYGNSVYKEFTIVYHYTDSGDEIGTAYIVVDASVVGLDTLEEPYAYRIKQDEPASYAVMAMLEDCGYEVEYGGSLDNGFYLKRITRGAMADGAEIPEDLDRLLTVDGLSKTGQISPDSLGEFDFTQGSGWMYSVGGETYAGKGLSEYYLSNGDTLYLRFTLSYGKDIGLTGGSQGLLPYYCCTWFRGTCSENHEWEDSVVIQEATCTEDGIMASQCKICGKEDNTQSIPALGHDYQMTSRTEPTEDTDGLEIDTCTRCGDTQETVLPRTGGDEPSE